METGIPNDESTWKDTALKIGAWAFSLAAACCAVGVGILYGRREERARIAEEGARAAAENARLAAVFAEADAACEDICRRRTREREAPAGPDSGIPPGGDQA